MQIIRSSTEISPVKCRDVVCAHMPCFCRPGHIYIVLHEELLCTGVDPGGVQRVPWNPFFEKAFLTRDTLIEQPN